MDTTEADALDRADMHRLAAGQHEALNALMARHAVRVFHFLYRMLGDREDANDLAQETFVRVYLARHTYRASERFSHWLYTIAANLARNQLRWRARHPEVSLDAGSETHEQVLLDTLPAQTDTPDQQIEAQQRAAAVQAAVQRLPPELREAFVLCEWEELSVAEAAAILGLTPKAVESRCYRARQLLRAQLKDLL